MKKLFFLFVLFTGINFSANALVTKTDIESMLTAIGTSLDKIETIYVNNTTSYFADGTNKLTYNEYSKKSGNIVSLTDTGIKLTYAPAGVVTSIYFIPYSSIITIDAGKDYLSISLFG